MKNLRVYLIASLVVVVLLVGTGFLLTSGKAIGQPLFGKSYSEGELKNYVSSVLRQQLNGVSCQPVDTDANGYVSCDYTTVAEPNVTRSIECSAWGLQGFLNRGCKARSILPVR
ncbi:hypothetical protein C7H19_04820 [Aphanothece hegewaldii CCALA 016]|uniref:Uncharacterized protein n=1 Tax=Aphanothece hegewaldii CCALA 016 TaxID=2107694 RepID=A0A2T1M0W6_9CHRO|nr:hypothetical protein [Aphanothece hegewaldii]PSF38321.1 hypothetical protein C7H19_04820 [Aphanothece hegewaldii CCALA 016]